MHTVLGNNDVTLRGALPERLVVDVDGLTVGMVHDSGITKGRPTRLRRWFPTCDLVVFGHSHTPVDRRRLDGQWLVNPGSPTRRNGASRRPRSRLHVEHGALVQHEIVRV